MKKKIKNLKEIGIVFFLAIFATLFFIYFYKGPTAFGDDLAYVGVAYDIYTGSFKESDYIFSHRFLVNFPIAFFYFLFGPSNFSTSLWSLFCAVSTTILTYFIGSLIYNKKVGFLSALLFVFFPMVGMLATASGDNIPMEFFAALSVFFFLWARKENDENRKNWKYFLSGFFLSCGLLTTPQSFVMFFFFVCYAILSYALNKKVKINYSTFSFLFGSILIFVILGVYEYFTLKNPLFFFTSQINFYSRIGEIENNAYVGIPGATQDPNFYLRVMFPYSFDFSSVDRFFSTLWNDLNADTNYAGFFFYFFILACFFVILLKERRSYLMILWAFSTIGYLQFGTMSFHQYIFMHRLERFLLIAAVPICVTIAIFLEKIIELKNPIKYFVFLGSIFILLYPSIKINTYFYKVNYYVKFDASNIAKALMNKSDIVVYAPSGQIEFLRLFLNFKKDINFIAFDFMKNCSEIKNNYYVVAPVSIYGLPENSPCTNWAYGDLTQKCGFRLISSSKVYEYATLHNDSQFVNPSFALNLFKT
ncbi:MAG: ArnT family glycosyltransferase [Candidatus Micrarchaeia archaeon]